MANTPRDPVLRLAERQARVAAFIDARRAQLEPLRKERAACIDALEQAQQRFINAALPDLSEASLAPFEKAAKAAMSDFSPTALAQRLRSQSEKAGKQCLRYEREVGIYELAQQLPAQEAKVAAARQQLDDSRRELERLEVLLEPLATLNQKRAAQGLPEISLENADSFARLPGFAHYRRHLTDASYRETRQVFGAIEQDSLTVRQQLWRRAQLQTDVLVREQDTDILQQELTHQRGWLDAYVTAWTSRLSETQLLSVVREAVADQLRDPVFRQSVMADFGRRWPEAIGQLLTRIEAIDRTTRRFHTAFDAHYEAGRIEASGEMASRRRTPHNVGT